MFNYILSNPREYNELLQYITLFLLFFHFNCIHVQHPIMRTVQATAWKTRINGIL